MLVFSLIFVFAGCSHNDTTSAPLPSSLDWNLYGIWVSADGELGDSVVLSISGETPITPEENKLISADLDIIWPEGYTYLNSGSETFYGYFRNNDSYPYYWFSSFLYNKDIDDLDSAVLVIYPTEELAFS